MENQLDPLMDDRHRYLPFSATHRWYCPGKSVIRIIELNLQIATAPVNDILHLAPTEMEGELLLVIYQKQFLSIVDVPVLNICRSSASLVDG